MSSFLKNSSVIFLFSAFWPVFSEETLLEEKHVSSLTEDTDACSVILDKSISIPEKIDQISLLKDEEAQNCLESLKFSVFQNSEDPIEDPTFSKLSNDSVNARVLELIQGLTRPVLRVSQPPLSKIFQNKVTLVMGENIVFSFRSNSHSNDYFAINAFTDLSIKDIDSEIRKFRPLHGSRGLLKKTENPTKRGKQEASSLIQNNTELESIESMRAEADQTQRQFDTNIYIEFPNYFICEKGEKIPGLTQLLIRSFRKHEKDLSQFIEDYPKIAADYMAAANAVLSMTGHNTFSLEYIGPQVIFSLNHDSEYRQAILQFLSDRSQEDFQNNLNEFLQMEQSYNFTKQFIAEYLNCFPKSYQERLFISRSSPFPAALSNDSEYSSDHIENPILKNIIEFVQSLEMPEINSEKPSDSESEQQSPFDLKIQYELRSQSSPMLHSYTKGDEAHLIVQTSILNIQNSTTNEINERYDFGWTSDLEDAANFEFLGEASP